MELLASLSLPQALYGVAVVLLGYTVLGLSGFGSALVMVPLLGWQWPLTTVVPLVLLLDVPASLLYGGLNLKHVAWPEVRRLILPMVAGAAAGAWLAAHAPGLWPLLALGVYVVAVGVRGLRLSWRPAAKPPLAAPAWAPLAGGLIGAIETLFGTAGPPVLMWLARRVPDISTLRATTPPTIVVAALLALVSMQLSGQASLPELALPGLALAGVALIGVMLGHRLAQRLAPTVIARIIYGLLVVSGLAMCVRALPH